MECLNFVWGEWSSVDHYPNIQIFVEDIGSSATRDLTEVVIPGRNGTLHIDNGRYKDVEERYRVLFNADTPEELQELLCEFRRAFDGVNVKYYHSADERHYMEGMVDSFGLSGVNTPTCAEYDLKITRRAERFIHGEIETLNNVTSDEFNKFLEGYFYFEKPDGAVDQCRPIITVEASNFTYILCNFFGHNADGLVGIGGYGINSPIQEPPFPDGTGPFDGTLVIDTSTNLYKYTGGGTVSMHYSSSDLGKMDLGPFVDGDMIFVAVNSAFPDQDMYAKVSIDWRWWEL